jgi:hypothetical protein
VNDDDPASRLDSLKAEHRRLEQEIELLSAQGAADQLQVARLKKRKLWVKDQIQLISNSNIPDIIA